jgi:hypothetical protein
MAYECRKILMTQNRNASNEIFSLSFSGATSNPVTDDRCMGTVGIEPLPAAEPKNFGNHRYCKGYNSVGWRSWSAPFAARQPMAQAEAPMPLHPANVRGSKIPRGAARKDDLRLYAI